MNAATCLHTLRTSFSTVKLLAGVLIYVNSGLVGQTQLRRTLGLMLTFFTKHSQPDSFNTNQLVRGPGGVEGH